MNPKELVGLAEAYMDVYSAQELDEAKLPLNKEKVKKQIEKKVSSDKPKDWYNAGRMMGHTGIKVENYDLYDIILSHLLDEGYADTEESATAIMANMSEEWRESIVEAKMPLNKEKVKKQIEKKVASDKPKDWYNAGRMMGHTGVKAEETTTEPDPFGRPGGKYGGVKKGGGYDRGNEEVKKKIAELDSKKKS